MKLHFSLLLATIGTLFFTGLITAADNDHDPAAPPPGVPESDLKEVTPEYPRVIFDSPPLAKNIPNLELPDFAKIKKRLTFKLPKDATNVALHKEVTSSESTPIIGSLGLITDGDADGEDGYYVELSPGKQWVQIDLGANFQLWKILLWHFHKWEVVYFHVAVQISDDPTFVHNVTTVFNNDADDELGFGKGTDKNYVETNHGHLIDAQGTSGRYVRLWSKGNSANSMNHYVEVSVYGSPIKETRKRS